jgi:hypothetical protein
MVLPCENDHPHFDIDRRSKPVSFGMKIICYLEGTGNGERGTGSSGAERLLCGGAGEQETNKQQQTTNNKQQTTNNKQQTTNNQQQITVNF